MIESPLLEKPRTPIASKVTTNPINLLRTAARLREDDDGGGF